MAYPIFYWWCVYLIYFFSISARHAWNAQKGKFQTKSWFISGSGIINQYFFFFWNKLFHREQGTHISTIRFPVAQHNHQPVINNVTIIEISYSNRFEHNPSNVLLISWFCISVFFKVNFFNLHPSNHILGYYSNFEEGLHPPKTQNICVFTKLPYMFGWVRCITYW